MLLRSRLRRSVNSKRRLMLLRTLCHQGLVAPIHRSGSSREQELASRGRSVFETGWCRDRDSNPDGETPTVFETAASACSAIPARPPTIARQSQFQGKVASGLSNAVPIFRLHVTTPRRNQRGQPRELV